jgi:hypothetical protein
MKSARLLAVLPCAWLLTGCGALLHGSRADAPGVVVEVARN